MTNRSEGSDEYWELFETQAKYLSEPTQRQIAYDFCKLIEDDLDILGNKALKIIGELCVGKASLRKSKMAQKKLQNHLPKENIISPYSVLIWAIMENTTSYPTWYSASIAGSNVVALKRATYLELTKIVKKYLSDK